MSLVSVMSNETIVESMCDQRKPYLRMRVSDEIGATHERGKHLALDDSGKDFSTSSYRTSVEMTEQQKKILYSIFSVTEEELLTMKDI